jgi:hypothetical protein
MLRVRGELPGGGALAAVFHGRVLCGRKEDRESSTPWLPRSLQQLYSGQCATMKRRAAVIPFEFGPSRLAELPARKFPFYHETSNGSLKNV